MPTRFVDAPLRDPKRPSLAAHILGLGERRPASPDPPPSAQPKHRDPYTHNNRNTPTQPKRP